MRFLFNILGLLNWGFLCHADRRYLLQPGETLTRNQVLKVPKRRGKGTSSQGNSPQLHDLHDTSGVPPIPYPLGFVRSIKDDLEKSDPPTDHLPWKFLQMCLFHSFSYYLFWQICCLTSIFQIIRYRIEVIKVKLNKQINPNLTTTTILEPKNSTPPSDSTSISDLSGLTWCFFRWQLYHHGNLRDPPTQWHV